MAMDNYSPINDPRIPGRPVIDAALCSNCGLCAGECPSEVLRASDPFPVVDNSASALGCIACGHCMAVCPSDAISVTGRRMTPADAFKLSPPSLRASADALEALLQSRRSLRRYSERPVERETVERILAMASNAPMGFPPSDVGIIVVLGRERVRALAAELCVALKKFLFLETTAGRIMMKVTMKKKMIGLLKSYVLPGTREILEAQKSGKDLLLYDAPCVLVFHYPMEDSVDCALAASFASIGAESLGLGTCMNGMLVAAMQQDAALKARWGVPKENIVQCSMTLGYPAVKYLNGIRRRFASVDWRFAASLP